MNKVKICKSQYSFVLQEEWPLRIQYLFMEEYLHRCECAAGMGSDAHFKHLALVLYAITKIKDGIITMETCTQHLQAFHQAKKYDGSLVKMEDMVLRGKSVFINSGLTHLRHVYPRPEEMRNTPGYLDML